MMRRLISGMIALGGLTLVVAPAAAVTREDRGGPAGGHAGIADPDAGTERMANGIAGRSDVGAHVKHAKGMLSVLRDDPYLRDAYAWLNNH